MTSDRNLEDFILIAHRGASYDAPENTFEAFDLALSNGFHHVETDVQLSLDGHPVLIHDDTLDRTTTGSGIVTDATLAEIKALSAGSWFESPPDSIGNKDASSYTVSVVPTLDELCARYTSKFHVHLELKSTQPDLASVSKSTLERWGWLEPQAGLTISSFHFEQLERSLKVMPQVAHGWLLPEVTADAIEAAAGLGLSGIYPNANEVTADDVKLANDAGLSVRTWGIGNSRQALERAYRSGAMGTTIDWPTQARDFLKGL